MSTTLLSKSRLALRATPMIRATMRQPIRQQPLSTMQKLRQAAVEHGFDGLVQTEKVAKSDWRVQQKRLWHSATFYIPFTGAFFGWPFAAQYLVDGHL